MFYQRATATQYLSGPKNLSYAELEDGIAHVAAYLIERDLAGKRVLFVVRGDEAFAPLLLGCMRAGAVPLLLDPGTVAQQLRDILAHSPVDGLIADVDLIEHWRGAGVVLPTRQLPVLKNAPKGQLLGKLLGRRAPTDLDSWPGMLQRPPAAPLPPPRRQGVAYVIFTSGSTARPKGVEMSWPAMLSHLETLQRHYGLTPDARIMNLMPLSHADGLVQGVLLAYRCGITLVRPAAFSIVNIESVVIAVYRERVTHLVAAPTALTLIQQYGGHLAENFANGVFRFVISCSAPLSAPVWTDFTARFRVQVVNTYGLSETGTSGLYAGPDSTSHKIGSIGLPRDMVAKLLRADGSEADCDEAGELCLQGANLMDGYLDDPDTTARALRDGWLHTGDQARRDPDGVYWIVGRIKDLIICGGYNLSPEAINSVLMQHPAVLEAATVGMPDPTWGEIPASCVVLRPGQQANDAELLAHCARFLGAHELPKTIHFAAALPRTPSGKVILAQLQQSLLPGRSASSAGGDVRERVFALASDLFRVPAHHLSLASGPANTAGWDSLAHINFVIGIETGFGIRLSASDVVRMESLDATIELIKRHAA